MTQKLQSTVAIPNDYDLCAISDTNAKAYIHANHYSHGSHGGPSPCYGLYQGVGGLFGERELLGVIMFATPCSENVRISVFGKDFVKTVTELHRLHLSDKTPRNTESWVISRALRLLSVDRPNIRAVISFADPTQGHVGTIYQAANALYYGASETKRFWVDEQGRLRHPRQNGRNVDGSALGWVSTLRQGKHRYLWLIGNKRVKKESQQRLKLQCHLYPSALVSPTP